MTSDEKKQKNRNAAAERKRKSRANQKEKGFEKFEITLAESTSKKLKELCQVRAGVREHYDYNEFMILLIENNHKQLQDQLENLGSCDKCNCQLPKGCEGIFNGDSACWHTRDYREISL
jgi:hypothetical protein